LFNLLLSSRNRRLRHQSELQQMQLHFREEMNSIRMDVAEQTLKEVARDLHDEVGQLLTFSILQIGNLRKTPEEKQEAMMLEVQASVKDALDSVRSISRGLSPDIVNAIGLKASIEQLIDRAARRTGLPIHFDWPGNLEILQSSTRVVTFHMIRECLTNTIRHAEAKNAWIGFKEEGEMVSMIFEDDGKGFPKDELKVASMGLISMKQRAQLVKGDLYIADRNGGGSTITFTFPNNQKEL
jgi:signal transduction histidine kinase